MWPLRSSPSRCKRSAGARPPQPGAASATSDAHLRPGSMRSAWGNGLSGPKAGPPAFSLRQGSAALGAGAAPHSVGAAPLGRAADQAAQLLLSCTTGERASRLLLPGRWLPAPAGWSRGRRGTVFAPRVPAKLPQAGVVHGRRLGAPAAMRRR